MCIYYHFWTSSFLSWLTYYRYLGQLNVKDEYDLSSKIYAFDESSSGLSGHGKTIHHNAKDIAEQIDIALSNTKAKKFKIWYLHAPDRSVDYLETLKALDEQHKLGKFDILGLSNYPSYEVSFNKKNLHVKIYITNR